MASNIQPLTLHAHGTGPNPYKVAIALEALEIPYQVKLWEFGDAANGVKGSDFLKINENGRVPALEDPNTGVTSWESGAVINYVLRTYDSASVYGPKQNFTPQQIVDYDKWTFFLLTSLGPMTGQRNWYRHYNAKKNDDALERYGEQTLRCYQVLEEQLKKTGAESVLETGYSAVDWNFYPWVLQHKYAGLEIDQFPNLQMWLKNIGGRKEVLSAYAKVANGQSASVL